jgi:hypothetical protein
MSNRNFETKKFPKPKKKSRKEVNERRWNPIDRADRIVPTKKRIKSDDAGCRPIKKLNAGNKKKF